MAKQESKKAKPEVEKTEVQEKACFIIMPITTPEPMREVYRDGADHFHHVLNHLFIPSIKKAGFRPIPPIAKGADLIHAEIIKKLENSELVLCDMSCLNPNVFFELGIRTSLNKPVCMVKDEQTEKVPFDTGIVNYHEYQSSLDGWRIEEEREGLCRHILESAEGSKGENPLWRYFGMKSEAKAYQFEAGTESKLDYIAMEIGSLKQKLDNVQKPSPMTSEIPEQGESAVHGYIESRLNESLETLPIDSWRLTQLDRHSYRVDYTGNLSRARLLGLKEELMHRFDVHIRFNKLS